MKLRNTATVFFIASALASTTFAQEKVGDAQWKLRMQSMLTDVLALFPYAFDESKYQDSKNALTIKKALDSLATHSLSLKGHTAKFNSPLDAKADPSIRFVAQIFENEVGAAQIAFGGSPEAHRQSQNYLRSALAKCTMCHTQSSTGSELKLEQFKDQFAKLNFADRFLALIATRQFEEGLKDFSQTLRDAKVNKPDERTIDRQAKVALAIAVRVKRDPKLALRLIHEIEASKATSPMLQAELNDWKNSVLAWQADVATGVKDDAGLFAEAKRLIATSQKRENTIGHFENSNVPMLRASTTLHDLLTRFPRSPLRGESYLLLATTYDMLPGFAAWDLSEEYLSACIAEYSHTDMSEKCFRKYQTSTILGYSGSSGTNIPSAVVHHLARMKELATRKPVTNAKPK